MIRRSHNILQWLFAIFVVYLLLTRLFISWVQFSPDSFVAKVNSATGVELAFDKVALQQNWSGFSIQLQQFSAKGDDFELQAEKLAFDFNLFFFVLPTIDYGNQLVIENGAYQAVNNVTNLEAEAALNLQTLLESVQYIDLNVERLWKKVHLKNMVLSELAPGFSIQFNEFISLKKSYLSVVSEFSLSYKDVLDYEPFNFRATLNPQVFGGIQSGNLSLSSFKPLQLKRIARLLPKSWKEVLPEGEFIVDLTSQLANSQVIKSTINLNTQSLTWKQQDQALPKSLGFTFEWLKEQQNISNDAAGWRFSLSGIQIDNKYVPSVSPIYFDFLGDDFIAFAAQQFELEPFEVMIKALMQTELAGDVLERAVRLNISELSGRFNWQTLELPELSLFIGRLDLPVTDFPGMSMQNLQLQKSAEKFTVFAEKPIWVYEPKLHAKPMKVELPSVFAFGFDESNNAWNLPKLTIQINSIPVTMMFSQINSQYVDTEFSLNFVSMQQLKNYLPYPIMSEALQGWLKTALTGGQEINLSGQIRGFYKHFPFTENNGLFELKAKVKQASLKFNPNWPELKNFDAELFFKPYKLTINTPKVDLGHTNLAKDVSVVIDNLQQKDIQLITSGLVDTKLSQAVHYLNKTPLASRTGMASLSEAGAVFSGNTQITIKELRVPISGFKDQETQVEGWFDTQNGGLYLSNNIDFQNIRGRFYFSEKDFRAKNVRLSAFEGEAKLDVTTANKEKSIKLSSTGKAFDKKSLWFEKALPWQADLIIPFANKSQDKLRLKASINVDQAVSKLPAPFSQQELVGNKLQVSATMGGQNLQMNYQLSNLLNGRVHLSQLNNNFTLNQFQLTLGGTNSQNSEKTTSFIRGDMDKIVLQDWLDFLATLKSPDNVKEPSFLQKIQNWDKSVIRIRQLEYLSNSFENVLLSWFQNEEFPKYYFTSEAAQGSVLVRADDQLDVNVDKLVLQTAKEKVIQSTSSSLHCQTAVNREVAKQKTPLVVNFSGQNVTIDARQIESIDFVLVDDHLTKQISDIKGSFANKAGTFSGEYSLNKLSNQSQLETRFSSKDVSEIMRFLKIDRGFSGKKAEVNLNLNWLGGEECFSVQNTTGRINFALKDGSVEDVEPGLARLIGLLSVDSLVRRLKLDLKDVTNKGLVYDQITGEGVIKQGLLNLSSFEMKAPSANASISGSLNLTEQKFDLKAKVTPKVGSALPTIAAIAGSANPLTALAVYTIMKILPDVNENLISYSYTVTGPWSSPIINSVGNKKNRDTNLDGFLE